MRPLGRRLLPYSSVDRRRAAQTRSAHRIDSRAGPRDEDTQIGTKSRARHRYSVRIIGGRWRGRRIAIPRGTDVRPTPDRVRETVFNWLAGATPAAVCLDLFAGTGVFGLEALSRGAREVWLVERDAGLAKALRARVEELGAEAQVVQADVETFLRHRPPRAFDIVFLDPPYREPLEPIIGSLDAWLSDNAYVYVERPAAREGRSAVEGLDASLPGLKLIKEGRGGDVVFALLRFERP